MRVPVAFALALFAAGCPAPPSPGPLDDTAFPFDAWLEDPCPLGRSACVD